MKNEAPELPKLDMAIQVRDPEASLDFYQRLIRFTPFGEAAFDRRHVWTLRPGRDSVLKLVYDRDPPSRYGFGVLAAPVILRIS